jgi:hypothetical protein
MSSARKFLSCGDGNRFPIKDSPLKNRPNSLICSLKTYEMKDRYSAPVTTAELENRQEQQIRTLLVRFHRRFE